MMGVGRWMMEVGENFFAQRRNGITQWTQYF